MEQINPKKAATKITEIVAGINLVEIPFEVRVPIFIDEEVKRPVFIDEQIKVPAGWDKVINALALEISEKVIKHCLERLDKSLQEAISARISEIKIPRVIEELTVNYKDISMDRPVYVDIQVQRPIFIDHEIINPVKKDIEVFNAIIIDKPVINAVIDDVRVTNAIVKDVEVERAVIREKTIDVIHKNCFSQDGKPLV